MRNLSLVRKARSIEKIDQRIAEMEKFYQAVFNMPIGPMFFDLKPNPAGKEWTLIIPSWLTYTLAVEKYGKEKGLPFWKRGDINLPSSIDARHEARLAKNGTYAIALAPIRCGDIKFKNFSANQLHEQKVHGTTRLERDILGLWHYWKYKEHLDNKGFSTLCIGSRFTNGETPVVSYYMRKTDFYSFPSNYSMSKLLPREVEVISIPRPQLLQTKG